MTKEFHDGRFRDNVRNGNQAAMSILWRYSVLPKPLNEGLDIHCSLLPERGLLSGEGPHRGRALRT